MSFTILPNVSTPLAEKLNVQVANMAVLYMKLHHYHWYIKGPHFFTLHEKLEMMYNEINLYWDALAERMLTLGQSPVSTLKASLSTATIQEALGNESAQQIAEQLMLDFNHITGELQYITEMAEHENDQRTADLLTGMQAFLEKQIWMLQAFSQRED